MQEASPSSVENKKLAGRNPELSSLNMKARAPRQLLAREKPCDKARKNERDNGRLHSSLVEEVRKCDSALFPSRWEAMKFNFPNVHCILDTLVGSLATGSAEGSLLL